MTRSATLAGVRQRHYALQSLPETITVPSLGARRPVAVVLPLIPAVLYDALSERLFSSETLATTVAALGRLV